MEILKQKKFLNGKREFYLDDDKTIKVKFSSFSKTNEETIELFNLEDKFERIVYREIKYLIAFVPMFLIGCKFLYDAFIFPDVFPFAVSGLFLIPAALSLVYFFVLQQDQIIIRYYQSSDAALLIWNNRPNNKECAEFVSRLVETIKKLKLNPKLDNEKKLEIYSRYLEFLTDEKVLSEKEAKQIFDRTAKRMKKEASSSVVSLVQ